MAGDLETSLENGEELDEEGLTLERFLDRNKVSINLFLIGLILVGLGVFLYKQGFIGSTDKIEIINNESNAELDVAEAGEIVVEVSGAVEKPGVYRLKEGDRVEDLLIASGGLSIDADRSLIEKYVNRAAKLVDGQKLYIVKIGEQSLGESANNNGSIKLDQDVLGANLSGLTNINTATLSELDKLPEIGPAYGQRIVDHRPYSSIDELVSKGALKQFVYDKIKDLVSVY